MDGKENDCDNQFERQTVLWMLTHQSSWRDHFIVRQCEGRNWCIGQNIRHSQTDGVNKVGGGG